MRPLLDQTRHPALILWLLADGELDSDLQHTFTRQVFIATSIISAKRDKRAWRLYGVQVQMHTDLRVEHYGQRELIESAFSVTERKLSAKVASHPFDAQQMQALLLVIAFNLYYLRWRLLFAPLGP